MGGEGGTNYMGLLIPILFLAAFYFLVIRPQQKKDKKIKAMRSNLKVGDEVITIGGIYGKVVKIKEDLLIIEMGADKTKVNITKWAIGSVVSPTVEEKK